MKYVIGFYVLFMMLYWIEAKPGNELWTLSYYLAEKGIAAYGFIMLALYVDNKRIQRLALYAASVCVFMFLYFLYAFFFGHSITVAVTSLLFYSLITLYLIKK